MLRLIEDLDSIIAVGGSIDTVINSFKLLHNKTILPTELYWRMVYTYLCFQLFTARQDNREDHLIYLEELSGRVKLIFATIISRPPAN
jgi:hypothetical protein